MKDRIAHIMRAKNLKASDFASILGIQPSGVSHILSGRNKPSLEFVKKIKETFPEYNLDWIIFGTGPMTTSEPYKNAFAEALDSVQNPPSDTLPLDFSVPSQEVPSSSWEPQKPEEPRLDPTVFDGAGIKSVLVLYEDGTFDTYSPR